MWRNRGHPGDKARSIGSHFLEEALLQAYVDDRLAPRSRLEIEEYLSTRPGEAARIRDLQVQNQGFHALFDHHLAAPLPPELTFLQDRLEKALARRRRSRSVGWMAAAATLVVAAAGGWMAAGLQRPADGGWTELRPARSDLLGATAPVDLTRLGFAHVGTRRVGTNADVIQHVFESTSGRRVMLYESAAIEDRPRTSLTQDGAISILVWSRAGRAFTLVGELDREAMLQVGRAVNGTLSDDHGGALNRVGAPQPMR